MNMNSKSVVCRENNCSVQFSDNVTNMDMMVELVSVEARGPFANNSLMINMNES